MGLRMAAIRTGTEPVRRLRIHSFPRVLDEQLLCPKCDVSYSLTVDWDEAANKWFNENARPLISMLKKAVFLGHGDGHRVSHFETEGVVVERVVPEGSVARAAAVTEGKKPN